MLRNAPLLLSGHFFILNLVGTEFVMKKLVIALLSACTPLVAFANPPIPGVDYQVLNTSKVTGGKVEVREFFSYNCALCFTQHTALKPILKRWGNKVNHVRTPQKGYVNQGFSQQIYYTLESIDDYEAAHEKLLKNSAALNGKPISIREVNQILKDSKISLHKFNGNFSSPQIAKKLKEGGLLLTKYGIGNEAVVVINGKYSVSANAKNFASVVNHLLQQETTAK